jgi:antitoxin (DNA-binding transcriptional repressor) of toxin-antitoxin stability system
VTQELHGRCSQESRWGSRLKTRLRSYLRAVRSGATILVTERGEPVAELRPLPRGAGGLNVALDRLAALGMLTCGSGKKLDSFVPIRIRGRAASDAILRDRVDRF